MAYSYNASTTADEVVKDLTDHIKDKVILVTGISPGNIGATFVESIARAQPSLLILTGRNLAKTQQTVDTIYSAHPQAKVRLLELDLGSLATIRDGAATLNSWGDVPYVDVLVNNAGIMAVDFALSPDGFESQFATNHLGHFLFTNLIMDKILASKSPRVVNISSDGHRLNPIRWGDYNFHVRDMLRILPVEPNTWLIDAASRTENPITNGTRTASPRRRTCSWPFSWPKNLVRSVVCRPSVYIPASSKVPV